jgi:uracil-DNA glycosylase
MNWLEHVAKWKDCTRCPLHEQRDRIVLARGQLPCDVLFVGEAPGASEDAQGVPFWGPAGKLLDQIVERALPEGTPWAMTNLVACFPRWAKLAGENEPEHAEILACQPRLDEFTALAQPKLVVRVGALAQSYFYSTVQGFTMCDIVHPAHILRNMPAAQKHMATLKCIVQVRTAFDKVMEDYKCQ